MPTIDIFTADGKLMVLYYTDTEEMLVTGREQDDEGSMGMLSTMPNAAPLKGS